MTALRSRSTPRTAPGFAMPAPSMSGNSDMQEKEREQGNAARRACSLKCFFGAISWQQVRNPTLGIASRSARRDELPGAGCCRAGGSEGSGAGAAPGTGLGLEGRRDGLPRLTLSLSRGLLSVVPAFYAAHRLQRFASLLNRVCFESRSKSFHPCIP